MFYINIYRDSKGFPDVSHTMAAEWQAVTHAADKICYEQSYTEYLYTICVIKDEPVKLCLKDKILGEVMAELRSLDNSDPSDLIYGAKILERSKAFNAEKGNAQIIKLNDFRRTHG